ncbi:MAG: tetratricopeptide repeat protein [Candidatus Zixiibacteriota bacterium]
MTEYLLIFFVLLLGSLVFYLIYERYAGKATKSVSTLYIDAHKDLLDGRPFAAFTKLHKVVSVDSNNIDAYLRLGQILRENKKPERALQVHKDLTLRGGLSTAHKVAILRQLALDYKELKNYDMTEAALKELISLQHDDLWAYTCLLQIQKEQGEWEEAYDTAATLLKLESDKSKKPLAVFKYRQGEQLYKQKEYHKARIIFKEAIGLDPSFAPAYIAIGDSYYDEQRYEDAVNFWNKLIEAVPDQGHQVIERLKKTLFDLGRFGDIAEMCEKILKHSPKNREARLTLAEFFEKKGDLEAAEELLSRAIDDSPDDMEAIVKLIQIYLERKDMKKIDELFSNLELKLETKRVQRQNNVPGEPVEAGLIGTS